MFSHQRDLLEDLRGCVALWGGSSHTAAAPGKGQGRARRHLAVGAAAPAPRSGSGPVAKTKKRLARRAWSDETGDNSNTQYAMLGLKLERAGSLAQTESFNGRLWYNEGAAWLLEKQRGDGTWVGPVDKESRVLLDTCWAILFLKRATRHLVYTK